MKPYSATLADLYEIAGNIASGHAATVAMVDAITEIAGVVAAHVGDETSAPEAIALITLRRLMGTPVAQAASVTYGRVLVLILPVLRNRVLLTLDEERRA